MTRVVVVAKQSLYGRFVEEENDPRVRGLIERRDPVVKRWRRAHEEHLRTLEQVQRVLARNGAHATLIDHPRREFDTTDSTPSSADCKADRIWPTRGAKVAGSRNSSDTAAFNT